MLGALAGIFRPALPDPAVSAGIRSAGKTAAGCWGFAVTPPMCSRTVLIQGAVALRQYPKSLFGAHGRAPTCSFSDACSLALHIGYAAQAKCVLSNYSKVSSNVVFKVVSKVLKLRFLSLLNLGLWFLCSSLSTRLSFSGLRRKKMHRILPWAEICALLFSN